MRQLHVLGVSEDGATLLLGTSKNAKPTHRIPLDDRLMRATRGQLAVNGDRAESALTPKEYQARMRAGASPEEVAKAAGVPVARVLPYFAPVEAERDRIVDEARGAVMRRSRGQDGTRPLGESVDAHLSAVAGIKDESVVWTARRRGDGAWIVAVSYAARGGRRKAEWLWQSADKVLSPLDSAAGRLGAELPAGATKRRTTKTAAKPAAKKATRKSPARKAPARKAPAAKKAAPRAAKPTVKQTVKKAAPVKTAAAAKKAGVRNAAKGTTRAAPVAKKVVRKPAPVVKRAVRKPAPKPAVRKRTPEPAVRKRTGPQVVTPTAAPAPVLEPVVELVPTPAPEPVERPAPEAPAAQAPAAPARKPGQRVPLPSWSEVLLGVSGKHDDGDQANGGGSGGRRAG